MSIRETFSNTISLPVTNGYDKDAVMQIWTVFGHVYDIACRSISATGLFGHLSDYVFGVRNFENRKSMSVIFFQNV